MSNDAKMKHAIGERDYDVGYGKPPVRTRFQAGASGNARGRPKKRRTTAETVDRELMEPVTVTIDGVTKRLPADRVIWRNVRNKALAGDLKAVRLLEEKRSQGTSPELETEIFSDSDDEMIEAALARRQARKP